MRIFNNSFSNVTNTANWLSIGSYAGGGSATLINNTIVNAGRGIAVQDPWDAKVQSSLFLGCTNGVTRSGSLSATVSYNGFFGNTTNFTGYPVTYGQVILANRNGTPCDLLFNIFQDPQFVSATDFHFQSNSPAIDAGSPDWAYTDMCITNGLSQGSSFPDLGAYGGPHACNWLDEVPVLPVTAFMTQTNGTVALNWGAIVHISGAIPDQLRSGCSKCLEQSPQWFSAGGWQTDGNQRADDNRHHAALLPGAEPRAETWRLNVFKPTVYPLTAMPSYRRYCAGGKGSRRGHSR